MNYIVRIVKGACSLLEDGDKRSFLAGVLSSATWDFIKYLGAALIIPLLTALWQYLHSRSIDWWAIFLLFLVTVLVLLYQSYLLLRANPVRYYSSAPDSSDLTPSRRGNSLFNPTQLMAFSLARDLRRMVAACGSRPDADWSLPGKSDDPDWVARRLSERHQIAIPWLEKLRHLYARKFSDRLKDVTHRLGECGLDVNELHRSAESVATEQDILSVANRLDDLAIQLSRQNLPFDQDFDTASRYEQMSGEQMGRALQNFLGLGEFIELALQRKRRSR